MAKKNEVNQDLIDDAVSARKQGYRSYGEMKAASYAKYYTSNIKETIQKKRKEDGYLSVRERLAQ